MTTLIRPRALVLLLALAAIVGGGLPMGGCEGSPTRRIVLSDGPNISPTTLPTIEVENPNGSVHILVDPKLDRPIVEADVKSDARLTSAERARLNERLRLSASTMVEDNHTVLRVDLGPRARADNDPVRLVIRTPSCGGAIIRNAGGPVELVGVGGELNIVSGDDGHAGGPIRIRSEVPLHGPMHIETTRGDVVVYAPPDSSGDVTLSTDNGRARLYARGGKVESASALPRRWTGRINDGENEVSIHTRSGNVRLTLMDYPFNRGGTFDWAMMPDR